MENILDNNNIETKNNENSNLNNPDINKLTLELLINKNHYNKYLSKNDPTKYKEQQDYFDKIYKYRNKILDLTNDLIQDPKIQINNELNEIFHNYIRTCIRYFEMKEMERNSEKKYNGYDNDEDDILFNSIKNDNIKMEDIDDNENGDNFEPNKSFWGKEKVIKSKMSNYDIRMFSNKR
jgi:hypothetical protein